MLPKWTFVLAWGVLQILAFHPQFMKTVGVLGNGKKHQQKCFPYVASTTISRKAKTVKTFERGSDLFIFLTMPNNSDSVKKSKHLKGQL